MLKKTALVYPFSLLYGGILSVRNLFFDCGIFRQQHVGLPIISVGNLSVGGTGKTPHVDWIADQLKANLSIGILLRGYGRNSKGFVRVAENSKRETVGDEALLYKKNHGSSIDVAVCEKRVLGVAKMVESNSSLDLIILDDAYQHRAIARDCNILLTDYNNPFWKDYVLPAGRLREFRTGKKRADVIVVTKCPPNLSIEEQYSIKRMIAPIDTQKVFFSSIEYGEVISFDAAPRSPIENVLLVTGIADAVPLKNYLAAQFNVNHIAFPDHHNFSQEDVRRVHQIFDIFATENKVIITTSKDAMRLLGAEFSVLLKDYPWCYQDMQIHMENEEELITEIKSKIC